MDHQLALAYSMLTGDSVAAAVSFLQSVLVKMGGHVKEALHSTPPPVSPPFIHSTREQRCVHVLVPPVESPPCLLSAQFIAS